ncbi:unnamed protein product [Brachionus calyciflorus]|uniref:nicotinamidase n=1 Tax=Brachionus calyciflorus TaxID=104777 RepID=A0A813V0F6_9BILA|nr:unnamed protein product [Brachionus calyciflorus]
MTEQNENGDFFLKYRNETLFNDKNSIVQCLKYFDKDNDQSLDLNEFEQLLKSLFSHNGNSYQIEMAKIKAMFDFFDSNKDGKIQLIELENFWFKIIKPTLFPKNALLIVDVQNDFITGTLSLTNCPSKHNGAEIVPIINNLIDTVPFETIAYSIDWHPADHSSFIENVNNRKLAENSPIKENIKTFDSVIYEAYPNVLQILWPAHCIQGTNGAKLHADLKQVDAKTDSLGRSVIYVYKGCLSDIDSYSAFFDNCRLNETSLHNDLKKLGITDLYICGIAADVCVAYTSMDALGLNYRVIYIQDGVRGVDSDNIKKQEINLVNNGALLIKSKDVYDMVGCKDRRPELAYATFLSLARSNKV